MLPAASGMLLVTVEELVICQKQNKKGLKKSILHNINYSANVFFK